MPKVLLSFALAAVLVPALVFAFTMELAPFVGGEPGGLSADCILAEYNTCSCWIWLYQDDPGAVWGIVLNPHECPGDCENGGEVSDVWLYSRCETPPGVIQRLAIESVDATACLTGLLYESGPITTTHCIASDAWTHIDVPLVNVMGNPFAITVEWAPGGTRLATDNGLANLMCNLGYSGTYPGCLWAGCSCQGWTMPPATTFIYVTDYNGDTILEDMCAVYGVPFALVSYLAYDIGYVANNLLAIVGFNCSEPWVVEPTSWGHVKALFGE